MKIYTKTGDNGTTSLVGGERVSKSHPRVEAYGDVDELISFLGLIISDTPEVEQSLRRIQISLMNVSAIFASTGEKSKLKPFDVSEISFLEKETDKMTEKMPAQTAFILPGSPRSSALCHVARCVCRRAERHAVAVADRSSEDSVAIQYLNRLSDYLFTLARFLCHESGGTDFNWIP